MRTFSAWELAIGAQAVFGFASSARSPADAPPRVSAIGEASDPADRRAARAGLERRRKRQDERLDTGAQLYVDYLASNGLPLPLT
eukprot:6616379-Pyramimonas_sp.AAC.1